MGMSSAFFEGNFFRLVDLKIKYAIFLGALVIAGIANAQDYQMKIYRVEDGLPSDVVKGVAQDSLGFLWIATDDGLVQFDGLRFTPFKSALHSQYAKGFFKTKSGKLLLYGDLDLVEIQNKIDTVIFKTVRRGGRNPTDSVLWYPKSVYEDSKGRFWLGEPQSVVMLEGEKDLKRFNFNMADRSPQFLRSFSFFENTAGDVFVCSYFGRIFKFTGQDLKKQEASLPTHINAVAMHKGLLWLATSDGIYTFDPDAMAKPQLIVKQNDAEAIQFLDDRHLLIGTGGQYHSIIDITTKAMQDLGHRINNINSIFISKEQDIWISSADGLILLQKNSFSKIESPPGFIESITKDVKTGNVYYCTKAALMLVREAEGQLQQEKILDIQHGYFLSLQASDRGLWVANGFSVFLLKQEKIFKKWDFESEGRFVHDLFLDADQNVWISQSGNTFISCITPDLKVRRYKIPLLETSIINAVRANDDGVYVAANGKDSYLFFKTKQDSVFKSVSLPVNFDIHGDFNINDLAFTPSAMWLASSEGLLKYHDQKIERVDLGEKYSAGSVKSVEQLDGEQLLFANSSGLFLFDIRSHNYWLFDEGNGLSSNTITARGIFVDDKKTVWIGTSKGLSFSKGKINEYEKTVTPYFVEARVNGVRQRFEKGIRMAYGSFLNLAVTVITFPERKVDLQYRIRQLENQWHNVEKNTITLSDIRAGHYTIEIKARKNGGYDWSDTRKLELLVAKPFWQQAWFLILFVFTVVVIFWIAFSISILINKKRREFLERLIAQRTIELKKANDELTTRNSELDRFVYSASHDLSAPLKSLLGLVNITRLEKPTSTQDAYLGMMEQSVKRMENFIKDVINYSRNARVAIEVTPIDLKKLIDTILADHQYAPNYGKIDFKVKVDLQSEFGCDEMRLKIILNNLISNAIKFQQIRDDRKPVIEIKAEEQPQHFIITVSDNGRGIPAEMVDKIFDMFYRATDSVQGSGLGLYILKESVAKLQGKVSVTSKLGEGSTFTVKFPKDFRNQGSVQK